MAGEYVAPTRTPIDHEELRATIARIWQEVFTEDPPESAVSMLVAQSADETGKWSHVWNFSLVGLKSDSSGLHTYLATNEVMSRAKAKQEVSRSTAAAPCKIVQDEGPAKVTVRYRTKHPTCRFRAYHSLEESVHGWVLLLARRYQGAITAARADEANAFVFALKKGRVLHRRP